MEKDVLCYIVMLICLEEKNFEEWVRTHVTPTKTMIF